MLEIQKGCSSQQVGCRPDHVDRRVVFRTPEVVGVMDLALDIIDRILDIDHMVKHRPVEGS